MEKAKSGQVSADAKHEEMEKFATKLVSEWHGHLTKLKELAPSIKKVEEYFQKHVRGSVTLMDCSSFKEFCEKRLKRHRSVVYKMLQNYKRDAEGGQGEHERKNKGGSSGSNRDQLKQELTEAKANVDRLLPVGQAAGKLANAFKEGNEALKEEAIKELLHTVEAAPPTGLNAGDQPNTELMLHDLLAEIQRVGDRIFSVAPTVVKLANAQIKRLSLHGKIGYVESAAAPPTQTATKTDLVEEMKRVIKEADESSAKVADVLKKIGNFSIIKRGKKFVTFDHTKEGNNTIAICGKMEEAVKAAEDAVAKEKPQVQAAAGIAA
jgi:hypothetical protein